MGNTFSCTSSGALLVTAAATNDVATAQKILAKHPRAAIYHSYKDWTSPLLHASAKGHFELVQLVLETAVASEGLARAKRLCLDHVNLKRQSALMVACKHGHPECVEYLAGNGADPLIMDARRHNTCLHLAALYGHSDCVHKLLSARSSHVEQGRQLHIAEIPCMDTGTCTMVKFVDCRNGWGLTALHIAVFQGAINTARMLLRHGASLDATITPPAVENSPIRCAIGSNVLHIAAMVGSVGIVKLILEAQEAIPGLELRSGLDGAGLRPQAYAHRNRNPVLAHLLDERLPVHLLRQVWLNYSLEAGMPARHHTLGSMLQKLKLMFNLEVLAAQRSISLADTLLSNGSGPAVVAGTTPLAEGGDGARGGEGANEEVKLAPPATRTSSKARSSVTAAGPGPAPLSSAQVAQATAIRAAWQQRLDEVQSLLTTVTLLHDSLVALLSNRTGTTTGPAAAAALLSTLANATATAPAVTAITAAAALAAPVLPAEGVLPAAEAAAAPAVQAGVTDVRAGAGTGDSEQVSTAVEGQDAPAQDGVAGADEHAGDAAVTVTTTGAPGLNNGPSSPAATLPNEAILDFMLCMLITPRTVSAVLHAAKKLVTGTVSMAAAGGDTGSRSGRGARGADGSDALAGGALVAPKTSSEAQHSMGLLLTALKAVETCLSAAAHLARSPPESLQHPHLFLSSLAAAAPAPMPVTATPAAPVVPDASGRDDSTAAGGVNQAARTGLPPPGVADLNTLYAGLAATTATALHTGPPVVGEEGSMVHLMAPPNARPAAVLPGAVMLGLAGQRPAVVPAAADPVVPHSGEDGDVAAGTPSGLQTMPPGLTVGGTPAPGGATAVQVQWGAQLHTLLAQLQWDIGIQRHRRRRQHAAAAAARATQAVQRRGSGARLTGDDLSAVHTTGDAAVGGGGEDAAPGRAAEAAGMAPGPGSAPADIGAAAGAASAPDASAGADGEGLGAGSTTMPAPPDLAVLCHVMSRRGDAPQDVLTAELQAGASPAVPNSPRTPASTGGLLAPSGVNGGQWVRSARAPTESDVSEVQALDARARSPAPPTAAPHGGDPAQHAGPGVALPAAAAAVAAAAALKKTGKAEPAPGDWAPQGDGLADSESGDDSVSGSSDAGVCAICMEHPMAVVSTQCQHGLCVQCALQLTVKGRESPSCPYCRTPIVGFGHRTAGSTVSRSSAPRAS